MRLRRVQLGSFPLVAHVCFWGDQTSCGFSRSALNDKLFDRNVTVHGFTAMTSISTSAPGAANAATCMAERAGLLGWSLVPKNWV